MFTQALGYERFMGRWSHILAERFLAFAGLHGAQSVLDVGSGTGSLARAIVDASPRVCVVGIDSSPTFVEHASANIRERARFEVGDAQKLPFADGSFDACCALLVLNFIPDQRKALAEMRRVAKPGGTIAAAVWDHAQGMHMLRIFWEVADVVDPDKHLIEEPQPMLERDGLIALWEATGLREIESAALDFDMRFSSFDDYWQPFGLAQGPAGTYLSGVSPQTRERIGHELRRRLLGEKKDGPFHLPARAWAIRGRVPA